MEYEVWMKSSDMKGQSLRWVKVAVRQSVSYIRDPNVDREEAAGLMSMFVYMCACLCVRRRSSLPGDFP